MQVPRMFNMKITIFWGVTPCSLVINQRFEGMYDISSKTVKPIYIIVIFNQKTNKEKFILCRALHK
jgi:hypothetical protein